MVVDAGRWAVWAWRVPAAGSLVVGFAGKSGRHVFSRPQGLRMHLHSWLRHLVSPRSVLFVLCALTVIGAGRAVSAGPTDRVLTTTVSAAITPVVADHLKDGIERAEREGYAAYLVRLDTPGGLDSSMRSIVQDILGSEVPVIVYISPQGARGASAGAIITFAAHVAAMAPGTTIGAATPVSRARRRRPRREDRQRRHRLRRVARRAAWS